MQTKFYSIFQKLVNSLDTIKTNDSRFEDIDLSTKHTRFEFWICVIGDLERDFNNLDFDDSDFSFKKFFIESFVEYWKVLTPKEAKRLYYWCIYNYNTYWNKFKSQNNYIFFS